MRNRPALTSDDAKSMMAAVMVGKECVGAIGVSGVQSHQDEQIALAGAKVVQS